MLKSLVVVMGTVLLAGCAGEALEEPPTDVSDEGAPAVESTVEPNGLASIPLGGAGIVKPPPPPSFGGTVYEGSDI